MADDGRAARAAEAVSRLTGEIWSRRRLDLVPVLYAPDHIRHEPGGDDGVGVEVARAAAARVHARFPGVPQDEHILLAEGDTVFRRWSFSGIHHAPDGTVSPRPVMLDAMTIYRMRDGLLAETWTTADWRGLGLHLAGEPVAADRRTVRRVLAAPGDDPAVRETALAAARALAAGDTGSVAAWFAPDCRDRSSHGTAAAGHDGLRAWMAARRAAFPALAVEIEDAVSVAAGEWAAVAWTCSGRQDGPVAGYPATGRVAAWGGQALFRVAGGRVAEFWRIEDEAGMLRRLGLTAG